MLDPGTTTSLPQIDLVTGRERRGAGARGGPGARGAANNTPREHRDPRLEPPAMMPASAPRLELPGPVASAPEVQPKEAPPASSAPATARSRVIALLELVGGLVVLYMGLRFGDSVLHGNASLLSVAVHGLALYGLGAGLVGLRP